jgi:hypothetical protein
MTPPRNFDNIIHKGIGATAYADSSVLLKVYGATVSLTAEECKRLGGELCHVGNAALKLQREANGIKPAEIVAGAVFYFTDSRNRDIQRTVMQVSADRFMFVEPLMFTRQSSALTAAGMAELANDLGYRKAR